MPAILRRAGGVAALLLACCMAATAASAGQAHAAEAPQARAAGPVNAQGAGIAPAFSAPAGLRRRAIVLAPHITELMYAAGAGPYIVATVDRSDYPVEARSVPRVGDGISVSLEAVMAARPDVILDWRPSGASRALKPLAARQGIPIVYVAPRRLDDIPEQVRRLGALFGTDDTARPAARLLQQRIDTLRTRYRQRRPLSVFVQISDPPLFTIGSDPVINDALRVCGGHNLFAELAAEASVVSRESVLLSRPEVVIAPETDAKRLLALRSQWAELGLGAALDGHVYAVEADHLFRPGPRLIDATQRLCALLDAAR